MSGSDVVTRARDASPLREAESDGRWYVRALPGSGRDGCGRACGAGLCSSPASALGCTQRTVHVPETTWPSARAMQSRLRGSDSRRTSGCAGWVSVTVVPSTLCTVAPVSRASVLRLWVRTAASTWGQYWRSPATSACP